jgi:hypothetical protein
MWIENPQLRNPDCKSGLASIANIMTNAAVRTGHKATFNEATQEVMVDGKVFNY